MGAFLPRRLFFDSQHFHDRIRPQNLRLSTRIAQPQIRGTYKWDFKSVWVETDYDDDGDDNDDDNNDDNDDDGNTTLTIDDYGVNGNEQ